MQKGVLRSILSGSIRLQDRLHKAGLNESPICLFCGLEPETVEHCFWRCPAWSKHRMGALIPRIFELDSLPMCTRVLGIFMEDEAVLATQAALDQNPPVPVMPVVGSGYDKVVVWTDGSSVNSRDARFQRAGAGIFYGAGRPLNVAIPGPGPVQTNQRAELFAVLNAIGREQRLLEIRSDSQYVVDGVRNWSKWCRQGWRGSHQDLWGRLSELLQARPAASVDIVKVLAHASAKDVLRGKVSAEDKWGNDGADALAKEAAMLQQVPENIMKEAMRRRQQAEAVQQRFLDIFHDRLRSEAELAEGEVMEDLWKHNLCAAEAGPRETKTCDWLWVPADPG